MLFTAPKFFLFFAVTLAFFYGSPRAARKYILLAASYFFYASWNPKFIALLLTLTAIDFTAGLWISRTEDARKKLALTLSLAANLAFLGFFKYYNFIAANVALLAGRAPKSFWLDIVLPLGISFHTFQSMSYVVDVYRGEQEVVRNPIDYALFICFFPQLVAGPIVRARNFFRDLLDWSAPSLEEVRYGIFLFLIGLTKKMAFADRFAAVADTYFGDIGGHPGWLAAWSGTIAFALQIFFDFSGYTDMAIGMAKLLGFHFPPNFRRPYLAWSLTEFWRRWHISLSSWLRDYLYIPFGGNRQGALRTYRNLMLTMLLGGLWHGASWNFVIWGGYHGALLSIERIVGIKQPRAWLHPFRVILTFALVCVSWVFFRASTLRESVSVIGQMFWSPPGVSLFQNFHFLLAAGALAVALLEEYAGLLERILRAPAWIQTAALTVMLFCLEIFGVVGVSIPFIYFQF